MSTKLIANIIIPIRITAMTGLHIGTSNDDYEIGGMDNPVIKYFRGNDYDRKGSYPYIPGSSLKGKMRSLMEWEEGKVDSDGKIHTCFELECPICRIFGGSAAEAKGKDKEEEKRKARLRGPGRLIVRDFFPTKKTREFMEYLEENEGLPKVEVKHENSINRLTAEANPRPQERVPVGSRFVGELVYSIYEIDEAKNEKQDAGNGKLDVQYIDKVIQALMLVEDSYLGGGGTRGSGKIKIEIAKDITIRNADDYKVSNNLTKPKPISSDDSKWDDDSLWISLSKFRNLKNLKLENNKVVMLEASNDNGISNA